MEQNTSLKTARQSNFELLRIVAMFFVLLLHANWLAFRFPTSSEIGISPISSFLRMWMEAITIVAVNTFVLISGYFGIRLRGKSLVSLLFQSGFYILGIYLVLVLALNKPLSPEQLLLNFSPLAPSGGWFIPIYVGLMLVSPALNTYVEQAPKKSLARLILLGLALEAIFGWGVNHLQVQNGYSVLSFVLLYLIGRYLNRYAEDFKRYQGSFYLKLFLGLSFVNALALYLLTALHLFVPSIPADLANKGMVAGLLLAYSSPINIAGAVCLVLVFSRIRIQSKAINWIASSTLAVYLIHCNEGLINWYISTVWVLSFYPMILFLIYLLLFLVAVFFGSILIDKLRIALWQYIGSPIYDRLSVLVKRSIPSISKTES